MDRMRTPDPAIRAGRVRPPSPLPFITLVLSLTLCGPLAAAESPKTKPPTPIPQFLVPGQEEAVERLGSLFQRFHSPKTRTTLWDGWVPMSVLWPAVGDPPSADAMRAFYRASLLGRLIDDEGYVSTVQHPGLAHSRGWPFPTWTQSGGKGWHFSLAGNPYARMLNTPVAASIDGWDLSGAASRGIDEARGLELELRAADASVATPPMQVDALVAPFIRLHWQADGFRPTDLCSLQWTTADAPEFADDRSMCFYPQARAGDLGYTDVPVYRHPRWKGPITRLRVGFGNPAGARVTLKSLITAVDSRHPINNPFFIQGSTDYFHWTGDLAFLRANVGRMREALRFAVEEFGTREHRCVLVPWVGHDGRTGIRKGPDGENRPHFGRGVGNNYWDLLPFGHKDCFATIYMVDALGRMADLEAEIARHPEWNLPGGALPLDPDDLRRHADELRDHGRRLFWNDEAGRFVACIDADGQAHDYGFTFLNLEAVHYGFASEQQSRRILEWVDGRRAVEGDTSTGADIYHWRFAPRATTKRNVEWYVWAWYHPENIPWGGQVQDGGAVLGFSYFDLMARLRVFGPDDAWERLRAILGWWADVEAAGGVDAYYRDPSRGTLQGGPRGPGGLGIDYEFMESVLVPQVMLYGFAGARPTADGLLVRPNLPGDWPSLTVTRVHYRDHVFDLTVRSDAVEVRPIGGEDLPLRVVREADRWIVRKK